MCPAAVQATLKADFNFCCSRRRVGGHVMLSRQEVVCVRSDVKEEVMHVTVTQGRWCAYDSELSHTGAPICPAAEQATLMAHFNGRAAAGDAWAGNMLRMTPCDLWPFLKGRTLWLLGDSITQARAALARIHSSR